MGAVGDHGRGAALRPARNGHPAEAGAGRVGRFEAGVDQQIPTHRLRISGGNGSGVDVVGLYTLAVILNAAAVLWAAGVAMRLRTMQAGPIMQMPVFLVLFFAPVYVPLSLLQGWIHGVAVVNPLTRVLEAGRGFLAGTPTEVGAAFAAAAALAVAFSLWAFRGLRKAEAAG